MSIRYGKRLLWAIIPAVALLLAAGIFPGVGAAPTASAVPAAWVVRPTAV